MTASTSSDIPFSFFLLGPALFLLGPGPGLGFRARGLGKHLLLPQVPGKAERESRKGRNALSVARHRDFGPNAPLRFAPMAAGEGFGARAPENFTRSRGATLCQSRATARAIADFGPNAPLRLAPMAAGEGFGAGPPETFTRSRGATFWQTNTVVDCGSCASFGVYRA